MRLARPHFRVVRISTHGKIIFFSSLLQSDVSMHEEEMERVDKALAAIFRSQLSGRSSKKQKKGDLFLAEFSMNRNFCFYFIFQMRRSL